MNPQGKKQHKQGSCEARKKKCSPRLYKPFRSFNDSSDIKDIKSILCPKYVDIKSFINIGEELSRGASGIVRKAHLALSGTPVACKSISKSNLRSEMDVLDLMVEVKAMGLLQRHLKIVRLFEVYEDQEYVHLVMELCEGGDLFSRLRHVKYFSEPEAASMCRTLASILMTCHKLGIMHRDIKAENILFFSPDSNTDIRLADFGSAAFFTPGQKLTQLVGSPLYIAPAVLRQSYGPEADIWSLGVVLYIMLSGLPPFWGRNNIEIFKKIMLSDLNLEKGRWRHVSQGAKDLVAKMLNRNPEEAMVAEDVLRDKWILEHTSVEASKMARQEPLVESNDCSSIC